jgi:hypothetical protein
LLAPPKTKILIDNMHKIIHVKLLFVQQIQHNTSNNKSKEDFYWKQKNKVFVHFDIVCTK